MAVKSMVMNAATIGGAGAYADSERSECDFTKAPTVPRCINSIFGLLQLEESLQGLNNSRAVAVQILGANNSNLLIDLKNEGFCVSPLTDSCTQDEVDRAVLGLYLPLKNGSDDDYTKANTNIQNQIKGKLAEFDDNGYIIDKAARKVTPPLGTPQSFSGGTTVAAKLFNKSEAKFSKILENIDKVAEQQSVINVDALLKVAKYLYERGGLLSSEPKGSFSSKTSASKATKPSFLAGLTDTEKSVASVAPQGEEVFGSVSERYHKMQKSGDFIQP